MWIFAAIILSPVAVAIAVSRAPSDPEGKAKTAEDPPDPARLGWWNKPLASRGGVAPRRRFPGAQVIPWNDDGSAAADAEADARIYRWNTGRRLPPPNDERADLMRD